MPAFPPRRNAWHSPEGFGLRRRAWHNCSHGPAPARYLVPSTPAHRRDTGALPFAPEAAELQNGKLTSERTWRTTGCLLEPELALRPWCGDTDVSSRKQSAEDREPDDAAQGCTAETLSCHGPDRPIACGAAGGIQGERAGAGQVHGRHIEALLSARTCQAG